MKEKYSIALFPLDNRPVSYLFPKQVADFAGIDLLTPERKYLGDLKHESDLDYLGHWLKDINKMPLIISLDNFVYGGLVQSRKHSFTLEKLKSRVDLFKNHYCRGMSEHAFTIYGFSSIMRIPNYNGSEEEKDYWKDYGEKIFKWSELMHQVSNKTVGTTPKLPLLIEEWYQSSKKIPVEIIADYKSHRDKNLTVNIFWLELLHKNCFEYLIFSCDDSAKYGMNVIEADYLKKEIKKHNFTNLTKVVSGTDEIPLVLLTKAILKNSNLMPSISLHFNSTTGKDKIARYESNSIHDSVLNQIGTLGIEIKDLKNSDIALFVHCADSVQGDHIFHKIPEDTKQNAHELKKLLEEIKKPFIVVDLAHANGADPNLIEALLNSKINWSQCYGYAGWNTCSNSTGSALAIAINRWIAEKENVFNKEAFKKCLLTRFLDDYAYQAKIRYSKITEEEVNEKIKPYVKEFSKLFGLTNAQVTCKLPWQRAFEVEVTIR